MREGALLYLEQTYPEIRIERTEKPKYCCLPPHVPLGRGKALIPTQRMTLFAAVPYHHLPKKRRGLRDRGTHFM